MKPVNASRLRIVPVTLREANAFVTQRHGVGGKVTHKRKSWPQDLAIGRIAPGQYLANGISVVKVDAGWYALGTAKDGEPAPEFPSLREALWAIADGRVVSTESLK